MSKQEKSGLGGLLGLFKKPKKGCCDMEIVETRDQPRKKGCCDFEIVPVKEEKKE
ncbi:hypothetical protein [Desulforamulus ferrireducens]|uniref:hypothetical protein n=1 Tax=Desulforamulus ferrireducens TaxID=1833852 RepID=UPI0014757793|nr:hypothetical protein [Desulforamulus ferrireducens]